MYTLETGDDEYVIVACCSTVLYRSSYVFRSLYCEMSFEPQVQTGPYKGLSRTPRKALGLGPNVRVNH